MSADEPETIEVTKELIRLTPEGSLKALQVLEQHETVLRRMADEDEQHAREAMRQAHAILFRWIHETEEGKIDLSDRALPWHHDAEAHHWTCNLASNRCTVQLTENNWFWQGLLERPNRFKLPSQWFFDLKEALAWAEQELLTAQREDEEEATQLLRAETRQPRTKARAKKTLKRYWIDASALEPERVTYQAIIDLHYMPDHYKTMELSFGKQVRYDEEFLNPARLARELGFDLNHVNVEQPLGHDDGWYRVTSRVTYYDQSVAAAQAQQLWERSRIVPQYQASKVIRARYGFGENETLYRTWLGACEDPDQPWPKSQNRAEYMTWRALEETLIYALDLERFRELLGFEPDDTGWHMSNDELLALMHKRRAKSPYIPQQAREESERWLHAHTRH